LSFQGINNTPEKCFFNLYQTQTQILKMIFALVPIGIFQEALAAFLKNAKTKRASKKIK
jgi:hypothetical protein